MLRSLSTRAFRRAGASALVLGLVSSFFVAVAPPALAADPPLGFFEIDGNLTLEQTKPPDDVALIDWATAASDSRITQFKTIGDDGASYIDSAKEHDPSTWECTTSEAPPKDDILRLYLASQINAANQLLHVGYVRDKGTGDTDINIEFHRNSAQFSCPDGDDDGIHRTDGDFMISFDFGGGDGAAQLDAYVWESSSGVGIADDFVPGDGHWVLQTPQPNILGSNNSEIVNDPLAQNASLAPRTFGEVTVDLSQYFRSGLLSCPGAGYVTPHSRASHSFASDVKDVLPETNFDLSDCGSLKLKKVDGDDKPMKDVTFGLYQKEEDGTKGAAVQLNGQDLTCTTDAAGICYFPKVPTGTFLLEEINLSGDYSPDPDLPYTVVINAFSLTDLTDTVAEWFVNTRKTGTLTVVKDLDPPTDSGKFDLLIDGVVKKANAGDGDSTGAFTVDTGTHTFGESAGTDTDLADYVATSSCKVGDDEINSAGGSVNVGHNQNVICTITNARITGSLTISKVTSGGTGTFVFDVVCEDGTDEVVTIVDSGVVTIGDIPTGTTCTVTERDNPLFSPTVIPADGRAVIDRDGETVAFTNTAKPNGLTLDKKVNGADHASVEDALQVHFGDPLTYTVVISNTGQVPLTITVLADVLYPEIVAACPQAVGSVLAAGASFTCTYRVAANDDENNVAAVSAVDDLGRLLTDADGTFVNVLHPALSIVKTASPESISVSGTVTYTYVVTNTGDTTLFDVLVTDDILGAIGRVGRLEPGEAVTMAKTVDVDASTPPRNIGTAVGTDALGETVTANDDAVITVVLAAVLAQPELPRTGAPIQAQAWAALAMVQVGLVLSLAGRRRRVIRRAD